MLINIFQDYFYSIFRGGKTYVYDVEAFALYKMSQSLSGKDQVNFLKQLNKLNFVQRAPSGKVVALYQSSDTYFKSWGEMLIENKQENLLAFEIKVSGDICPKRNLILSIYFHQGRISSIEYKSDVKWPNIQEKIRLKGMIWQNYKEPKINVLSSKLFF